VKTYPVKKHK